MPRSRTTGVAAGLAALAMLATACTSGADPTGQATTTQAPSSLGTAAAVAQLVPWWNDDVFYEVFVRSFADSDADGNGDLRGLTGKLDYLDDLGVSALWLMPIMQSPSYHGYDTTDYVTVESDYGSNADFQALVRAAHKRGMKVIIDLVLNHTSAEHPWFQDAQSATHAAHREWYVWNAENPGETTPWGTAAWHPSPSGNYLGLFWSGMPDLNYRNPAVTGQMEQVARFWLRDMGVDGFRLDAVRHLIEEGSEFSGTPATHDWLKDWDDHLDTLNASALTVGEIWDDTSVVAPYVAEDEVDAAFEFTIAQGILDSVNSADPDKYVSAVTRAVAAYPPGQFAPFLTNHDQPRTMTQLNGDVEKAKLAASALLTLPGLPFLYYGEEIGMTGDKPDEQIRTPMQWDSSRGAGFTDGQPWEPVNDDAGSVNVAAQSADPHSLLAHYRALLKLRAEHEALRGGGIAQLHSSCRAVSAHTRSSADGTDNVLVVLNFGESAAAGCSLSTDATGIPKGTYRAVDGFTGEAMVADVTVGDGGAVVGFTSPDLPPRAAAALVLIPAG